MEWIDAVLKTDQNVIKQEYITPKTIQNDEDYYSNIIEFFNNLYNVMNSNNAPGTFLNIVCDYKKIIIDTLDSYYSGNLVAAQTIIDNVITDLITNDKGVAISHIKNSISFHDKGIICYDEEIQNNASDVQFFRARLSDHFTTFDRNDMLHIPFDSREKIPTERFSIPGLPCLYLGTSSYCCWLELDTPPDFRFNVSAVELNNQQRILNLTVNSNDLSILNQTNDDQIIKTSFKLWLLSFVTSYRVKQKNRVFKSEYILPQLIMLSCLKENLDGIAYYTKRIENDLYAYLVSVNLALFAKYDKERKYSKICNNLKITKSHNYSMFKQLLYNQKYRTIRLNVQTGYYPRFICSGSLLNEYTGTEFYNFDQFLFAQNANELEEIDLSCFNT